MEIPVQPTPEESADAVRRTIVQTALLLAQRTGSWDAVHVHAVAREAGLSLAEVRRHFQDKDDIAEGWFDTADAQLLAAGTQAGWAELPIRERLFRAIMTWLDALAPHRKLAGEMLRYKLHPEHVHLQARGIMRISRTMQWLRDVALMPSVGWRRELEEATITSIYLATFACWLTDNTPGNQRTRRLLTRLLGSAERGANWLAFGA